MQLFNVCVYKLVNMVFAYALWLIARTIDLSAEFETLLKYYWLSSQLSECKIAHIRTGICIKRRTLGSNSGLC